MHNVSKWSGKFFAQRHVCNESRNIKSVEQINKRREAKRQTGAHGQAKKQTWHVSILEVQGHSRSSMFTPIKSLSVLLAMISSMSLP